jgi:hypothetical protein
MGALAGSAAQTGKDKRNQRSRTEQKENVPSKEDLCFPFLSFFLNQFLIPWIWFEDGYKCKASWAKMLRAIPE